MIIQSNYVDILKKKIFPAAIEIEKGKIKSIKPVKGNFSDYILPGFVDAHIHIESSMLTPYEFARIALTHGTVATVNDPHEIANVCGLKGVYYMLESARKAKLKFHFGAPSCVPATNFETAGAILDSKAVEELLKRDDIFYLSEMMNYPGVLFNNKEVMRKIALAKKYKKPVDGHAPGLPGKDAKKYIEAGKEGKVTISTDHECFTKKEALNKLKYGMKILIREGSAAKNFEALHELISEFPESVMLCSDDKHPDDLLLGHINQLVTRALAKGHNVFDVLRCACINPKLHYKLNSGTMKVGDAADFILVEDLKNFNVIATCIDGEKVAERGRSFLPERKNKIINNFNRTGFPDDDIHYSHLDRDIDVIEALDGQLITNHLKLKPRKRGSYAVSDIENDVLKIIVSNRYSDKGIDFHPAIAFIKNFGLKRGAIASTVAHDSHNIIAVGVSDGDIMKAVELLIKNKGGLSVVSGKTEKVLPLPIAGLMSDKSCQEVGAAYSEIDKLVKQLGCKLRSPYMTLSFMALLVIPDLKLSDKGLFSGKDFKFV
ncbi:MAG: adenine deaminase [Bacteroidia bacterium]